MGWGEGGGVLVSFQKHKKIPAHQKLLEKNPARVAIAEKIEKALYTIGNPGTIIMFISKKSILN